MQQDFYEVQGRLRDPIQQAAMNLSPKTVYRRLAKIPLSQAKLTFLVLHTWLQLGASMGSVKTDKHDLLP